MMQGQTNTYIVKFVMGQSDAVDRIERNLIRDGGSLSICDAALLHIKPFLETPRCCKKMGVKASSYREQYEDEKSAKMMVEIKLEHSQQEVERVKLAHRDTMAENLELKRTSAAVQAELDVAKAAIDSRDEHMKKLNADLAAAQKSSPRRDITAPASVFVVLQDKLAATRNELEASKKEAQELKHTVTNLTTSLAATNDELETTKKEAQELVQTVAHLTSSANELGAVKDQLAATDDELKHTVTRLTTSSSELAAVKVQLAATNVELEATKQHVQELKHTVTRLTASSSELAAVKVQLAATDDELDANKKEAGELKHTVNNLTTSLAATNDELETTKKEAQELMHTVAHLTTAKNELEATQKSSPSRNITAPAPVLAILKGKLTAAQDELVASKMEATAQMTASASALAIVKDELTASSSALVVVKNDLAATKIELEAYKKSSPGRDITSPVSALAVLKGKLAAAQDELEASKMEATAQLNATASDLAVVKDALTATKTELKACKKEAQELQYTVTHLTVATDELEASKKEANAHLTAMTSKLAAIQDELTATKSELEASKKEAQELKHTVTHLTVTADELEAVQKFNTIATTSKLAAIQDELTAAKNEVETLKRDKKQMAVNNFSTVSKKNGEITALKKNIKAMEKDAEDHQHTAAQLAAAIAELEATKTKAQDLQHTVTQLTDAKTEIETGKEDIMQQLLVTQSQLEVCMKEADITASELVDVKAELEERKKMTRPQKHLSKQITAAKKEIDAAKEEAQMHQQAALDKHMEAVAANHQLGLTAAAYDESQLVITNLEAKINSLNSTQHRTSEALRAVQHELSTAKADAAVAVHDLVTEKESSAALAAKSTQAQVTIADLRSQLEIVELELGAFKVPEPAPAPAPAPATPAESVADKMAAWGNAHALVRAGDQATRRANAAKAEAMKDKPAGEWREAYRATGSGKARQSGVDAARAVLDGIEADLAAKERTVASLNDALKDERAAGAERKRELAAARLALESTQGALREARASLLAAPTTTTSAPRCASCPELERQLRHARAGADAALIMLDEVHYKCMSTWAVLHDITWDVESKLSVRSETSGRAASTSPDESDGSVEVEVVGGDGEAVVWDRNTPPHLRRGGFAGRSLARHMPDLVRK